MSVKFRSLSRDIQRSMGNITNIVEESIIGHRIIKIFGGNYEKIHSTLPTLITEKI